MKIQEQIERLQIVHEKIYNENTGSPQEFASLLHISKRQLFNIIEELKIIGAPIDYDKNKKTYYYIVEYEIKIEVSFQPIDSSK